MSHVTGCFAACRQFQPPPHSMHVLLYHLSFYHSIYMLTHSKCTFISLFLPLACASELHSQDTLKQPVAMLCPASYQYLHMHTKLQ
jgi:hypothetical protein